METNAILSGCGQYRYTLSRVWDDSLPCGIAFGINPSTADETAEDQTTKKLRGFYTRWGMGGYVLLNPFAFRDRNQQGLLRAADPVGPDNDMHIADVLAGYDAPILCAWGSAKSAAVRSLLKQRLAALRPLFAGRELICLGKTNDGWPRHPLMLGYDTPTITYTI